jgi:hypothetical protein
MNGAMTAHGARREANGSAWSFPWHPFIATAAYLIGAYGATSIPIAWILRPLAVAVVTLVLLLLLARAVLRSWQLAGVAVMGLWVVIAGWAWLLVIPIGLAAIGRFIRRAPLPGPAAVSRGLNVVTAIWLAITLVGAVPTMVRAPLSIAPIAELDPARAESRPDIFLLLLDGYARGDTLASVGYDNEPFLSGLEARGFEVYRDATGKYETTARVVASLVHGSDAHALMRERPPGDAQRHLRALIEAAPLLEELRSVGYEIVTSAPTFGLVTLSSADVYLDDGQPTEFELSILSDTALAGIVLTVAPTLLMELHASRIHSNFSHVDAIASADGARPTFMLAHVMSPHPPFVFDASGELPPPLACYPAECRFGQTREIGLPADTFWDLYTDQLTYLNRLVLDAVDTIMAHPDAVIIVFSDHGSRRTADDKAEWHRTLFAARTPGAADVFDGVSHAPAILPVLMNAYFGADAPVLPQPREPASD